MTSKVIFQLVGLAAAAVGVIAIPLPFGETPDLDPSGIAGYQLGLLFGIVGLFESMVASPQELADARSEVVSHRMRADRLERFGEQYIQRAELLADTSIGQRLGGPTNLNDITNAAERMRDYKVRNWDQSRAE